MSEEQTSSFRASFGAGYNTTVINAHARDLRRVDDALQKICKHSILGIAFKWVQSSEQADTYQRISVLAITGGDVTLVLQVSPGPSPLPMSLSLLLTHQDYIKVGLSMRHTAAGKAWRDWGVCLSPLYDVDDDIYSCLEVEDAQTAVRLSLPDCNFVISDSVVESNWAQPQLTRSQVTLAAFDAWAARELWMELAKPQGFPPIVSNDPVDVGAIVGGARCPHCGDRFESLPATEAHIQTEHTFPCECCGRVMSTAASLKQHMYLEHIQCPDCAQWLRDAGAVHDHDDAHHNFFCSAGCGELFRTEAEVRKHLQEEHCKCQHCGAWFLDPDAMLMHRDLTHPTCPKCGLIFTSPSELKKHRYARVNGRCYPDSTGVEDSVGPEALDASTAEELMASGALPNNVTTVTSTPHRNNKAASTAARTGSRTPKRQSRSESHALCAFPVTPAGPKDLGVRAGNSTPAIRTSRASHATTAIAATTTTRQTSVPQGRYPSLATSTRVVTTASPQGSDQEGYSPAVPTEFFEPEDLKALRASQELDATTFGDPQETSRVDIDESGNRTFRDTYMAFNSTPHGPFIGRLLPGDPGEQPWNDPPNQNNFRMPPPMRLAHSADEVGLYG
eukprot:m.86838 g.86838  ORF g.86838 m.86838 type:complete len:617 (-) comp14889_c0_seq1:172-2022(-)